MTDRTIELDLHRGMKAQKATDLRRLLAEVEANEALLRARQEELEVRLVAAPSAGWPEAVEKVRYVLHQYIATLAAENTRQRMLVAAVLADMDRLLASPGDGAGPEAEDPAGPS